MEQEKDFILPPTGVDTGTDEKKEHGIEYDQRTAMLLMDLKEAREDVQYYRDLLAQQKNKELLVELKKLDPNIESIEQLGEEFEKLLEAGISTAVAYCAVNAVKGGREQPTMGDIKPEKSGEGDYFSFEDVSAMSKEQIKKNYDKVMRSTAHFKSAKKLKA